MLDRDPSPWRTIIQVSLAVAVPGGQGGSTRTRSPKHAVTGARGSAAAFTAIAGWDEQVLNWLGLLLPVDLDTEPELIFLRLTKHRSVLRV